MVNSLECVFDIEKAFIFGVGGGGDVVSCIPTARLLELHGVDTVVGGLSWERVPHDDRVGPRELSEVEPLDRVNETVGYVEEDTVTADGLEFTETRVKQHCGDARQVALLDITRGDIGLSEGFADFVEKEGFDLVVGIDAGGDVLAEGNEAGLESPLADGICLSSLCDLEVDTLLGVLGMGSDGELRQQEITYGVSRAAKRDGFVGAWGLTPETVKEMRGLLETVGTTEASKLPVDAAKGRFGKVEIRDGDRYVEMTPASVVTFYFDPVEVSATSRVVDLVRGSYSINEADSKLKDQGYVTEFEVEKRNLDG
ncbi:MAG: DUF1152 domain-containing protein [Halobacteria archaeon]